MALGKKTVILIAVMVSLAILMSDNIARVEGTRVLHLHMMGDKDFGHANHLETYSSSAYERAKQTMVTWLQSLASGPSPRGPGH